MAPQLESRVISEHVTTLLPLGLSKLSQATPYLALSDTIAGTGTPDADNCPRRGAAAGPRCQSPTEPRCPGRSEHCYSFIITDKYITVMVPLSGSDNAYIIATGEEHEAQGQVRAP